MKQILVALGAMLFNTAYTQTIIFQDDFESGSGSGNWTIDEGIGANRWYVNDEYEGFIGIEPDTPDQPAFFNGGVNSSYLHVAHTILCDAGYCNANYYNATTEDMSATQTIPISTIGYSSVTLNFWYLCAGYPGLTYGLVEYSTDGGSTWTAANSPYAGVGVWTNATITLPEFSNQASLKFRFRWINGGLGNNPGFSVDEIKISGVSGSAISIATGATSEPAYCVYESYNIAVPFTVAGPVNAGNEYIAQLSSVTGSFATPSTIGTLSSSSNGNLSISGTIPSGLILGNQYRIRVVSTDPPSVGTDNGSNLSVIGRPDVSVTGNPPSGIICAGKSADLTGNGAAYFLWSPGASLSSTTDQHVTATPSQTTTYTLVGTDTYGCFKVVNYTLIVNSCLGLEDHETITWNCYPNPVSNTLTVDFPEQVISIQLKDARGRTVYTSGDVKAINTADLAPGPYTVFVTSESGIYHKQIVKN